MATKPPTRYKLWLIWHFPASKSSNVSRLATVAIHRYGLLLVERAPTRSARAGRGAISWEVEQNMGWNQWVNRSKMVYSWRLLMIFTIYRYYMTIYDYIYGNLWRFSVHISKDVQWFASVSQAGYQIAFSPGSRISSLKQTHGDLDSRTLMTCSVMLNHSL